MFVKRSPPKTSNNDKTSTSLTAVGGGVADSLTQKATVVPPVPHMENVTLRKKQSLETNKGKSMSMDDFIHEMKEMFSAFRKEQDKKLSALQVSVNDIKSQNDEIVKSLDFLSDKYEELRGIVDILERDRKQNQNYVMTLENKIEALERKSRSTCLEIRNVPKLIKTETRQTLSDTVKKISSVLTVNLENEDIKDAYRIYTKKENDKTIIVDFTTVKKREEILQGFRAYNRKNKDRKFNTALIGKEGVAEAVYMSEYLTYQAKKLHHLARDFAKSNNYSFCWTQNGTVFLRQKEGSPAIKILSEKDLPSTPNK